MRKRALVFEGKDMTVLYGSGRGIERGDMAFTLYLDYRGGWEDKTALSKEIQAEVRPDHRHVSVARQRDTVEPTTRAHPERCTLCLFADLLGAIPFK